MVGMTTSEMDGSLSPRQGVSASSTVSRCSEAVKLLAKVFEEDSLEAELDQVSCQIQDVDRVRQVAEDIDKGSGHLASHV